MVGVVATCVIVLVLLLVCIVVMGTAWSRYVPALVAPRKTQHQSELPRVFVINLDRRPDRRQAMAQKMAKAGIKHATFVKAVDGSTLRATPDITAMFRSHATKRRGEIGCALSHWGLWLALAADPDPAATWAIFEDDVTFRDCFNAATDLTTSAPDVLRLLGYTTAGKSLPSKPETAPVPMNWADYWGGLFAYVLTRPVARLLVAHIQVSGMVAALDNIVAQLKPCAEHVGSCESLSYHAAPAQRSGTTSDIQARHGTNDVLVM
jgi:hypothetical protein